MSCTDNKVVICGSDKSLAYASAMQSALTTTGPVVVSDRESIVRDGERFEDYDTYQMAKMEDEHNERYMNNVLGDKMEQAPIFNNLNMGSVASAVAGLETMGLGSMFGMGKVEEVKTLKQKKAIKRKKNIAKASRRRNRKR